MQKARGAASARGKSKILRKGDSKKQKPRWKVANGTSASAASSLRRLAARDTNKKGGKAVAMKRKHLPTKPQASKAGLVKLGAAQAKRRVLKPKILKEVAKCRGLVLGQAPPGPPSSLPKGWRPLQGPAEDRLAKLAGLKGPDDLWQRLDRGNLLSFYPGLKARSAHHDTSKGYKLHTSDGDIFPLELARKAAASLDSSLYSHILLLGQNVARAFKVRPELLQPQKVGKQTLMVFPHPSGVSHFWNDPSNVSRASKQLRKFLRSLGRKDTPGRRKLGKS